MEWNASRWQAGLTAANSYIVNYGRVLRAAVMQGTVYLQTNVYHPQGGEAVMLLGAPHPTAVFLNHEKVYSRFVRPLYFDPIDGFATRIPLTLKSGWNSILIKFLHNSPDDGKDAGIHLPHRAGQRRRHRRPGVEFES